MPSYTTAPNTATSQDYIDKITAFINDWLSPTGQKFAALDTKLSALENQQTITQAQYDAINSERDAIRNDFNINGAPVGTAAIELFNKLSAEEQSKTKGTEFYAPTVRTGIQALFALSASQKERLYALSQKIEGRGEGE